MDFDLGLQLGCLQPAPQQDVPALSDSEVLTFIRALEGKDLQRAWTMLPALRKAMPLDMEKILGDEEEISMNSEELLTIVEFQEKPDRREDCCMAALSVIESSGSKDLGLTVEWIEMLVSLGLRHFQALEKASQDEWISALSAFPKSALPHTNKWLPYKHLFLVVAHSYQANYEQGSSALRQMSTEQVQALTNSPLYVKLLVEGGFCLLNCLQYGEAMLLT
jgi:hypothetical protein